MRALILAALLGCGQAPPAAAPDGPLPLCSTLGSAAICTQAGMCEVNGVACQRPSCGFHCDAGATATLN